MVRSPPRAAFSTASTVNANESRSRMTDDCQPMTPRRPARRHVLRCGGLRPLDAGYPDARIHRAPRTIHRATATTCRSARAWRRHRPTRRGGRAHSAPSRWPPASRPCPPPPRVSLGSFSAHSRLILGSFSAPAGRLRQGAPPSPPGAAAPSPARTATRAWRPARHPRLPWACRGGGWQGRLTRWPCGRPSRADVAAGSSRRPR